MDGQERQIRQAFERPDWYLARAAYNIRIRAETIKAFTDGTKMENVLDIGCGDGSLSMQFISADGKVVLVDRSKAMLEIALTRVPHEASGRVVTINEDFMSARLPEQSFDLVLCVGVLAYVTQRREFVAKIGSLLKPGGTAIVECTDGTHFVSSINRAYKGLLTRLGRNGFQTIMRPGSEVVAMFREIGLELRKSFRYSLPLPGFQRLLSQRMSYRAVRLVFGTAEHNRRAYLGNECIYCFSNGKTEK